MSQAGRRSRGRGRLASKQGGMGGAWGQGDQPAVTVNLDLSSHC